MATIVIDARWASGWSKTAHNLVWSGMLTNRPERPSGTRVARPAVFVYLEAGVA